MVELKYKQLQFFLKEQIQKGDYRIGDYLPSENELCNRFSITRTTARKALDELLKEGFIEKHHGKGSRVRERRKSLGLLNVRGFSEAVGENVKTQFLKKPEKGKWSEEILMPVQKNERSSACIFFERVRHVDNDPVMLERNWFPSSPLPGFLKQEFVDGSFFKTLSQKFFIEITGSTQELRAEFADQNIARLLNMRHGGPVLHISIKFFTSSHKLNIYSELYCNTNKFPVGNSYFV